VGSPGYQMLHVSEVTSSFQKNSKNNVKMIRKRAKRGKEREAQVHYFEEHEEEGMMRRGWLRVGGYVLLGGR